MLRSKLLILTIAGAGMLLQSCRTSKTTTSSSQTDTQLLQDSTSYTRVESTTYFPVPVEQTSLAVPPDLLDRIIGLPTGMGIRTRQGDTNLHIESDGEGGLLVTAETAPHQGVTTIKEESANRIRAETNTQQTEASETKKIRYSMTHLFIAGLAVAVVVVVIMRFKNYLKSK